MSNFLRHEPMANAKRYDRKQRKMVTLPQPHLIHEYNQRMGGVDLFDNAMNNYRIRVRGKKWYWPLLTNALDAAMVNAWKIDCLCRRFAKEPLSHQFEFRVAVVEEIASRHKTVNNPGRSVVTTAELAMRTDRVDHLITRLENRRRCRHCSGKTEFGCVKCQANLHPDCFVPYHNNALPAKKPGA